MIVLTTRMYPYECYCSYIISDMQCFREPSHQVFNDIFLLSQHSDVQAASERIASASRH